MMRIYTAAILLAAPKLHAGPMNAPAGESALRVWSVPSTLVSANISAMPQEFPRIETGADLLVPDPALIIIDAPSLSPNPATLVSPAETITARSADTMNSAHRIASAISDGGKAEVVYDTTRLNDFGSRLSRRTGDNGARWKMHKNLARKIVDHGAFFMAPFHSAMQRPIIDAAEYLAANGDAESVSRLAKLFTQFTPADSQYNPRADVRAEIRAAAARALVRLLPRDEALNFAANYISQTGAVNMRGEPVISLLKLLKKQGLREVSPVLMEQARRVKEQFENETALFKTGKKRSLHYENLYKYEDLTYTAYQLSTDPRGREEALRSLIAEYNRADVGSFRYRSHDNINIILCQIVDHDLAAAPAERARVVAQLNAERFENDMSYYQDLKKLTGKEFLISGV